MSVADSFDYDHRGFDYIGFDIYPNSPELEEYQLMLREIVKIHEEKVKRDKAKGIIILETGAMTEEPTFALELAGGIAVGKEGQAKAIRVLLEETRGRVDGIFLAVWESPFYRIKRQPF